MKKLFYLLLALLNNLIYAQNNTFLGSRSGINISTGIANTFVGNQAGFSSTTGQANVFIGNQAGYTNTTGISNLFMGSQAGANSNGSYNMFMGNSSGGFTTTGIGNTAIGDGSFLNNTIGDNNTAVGRYAGIYNTTGTLNTFIGVGATSPSGTGNLTNATAIGYNALVMVSNAMILGNANVNVGIGNSAPQNKLEITKGVANQSGLRFTNLTHSSPASITNQSKFLTVNSQGDVVLGSVNASSREGVVESFWQRNGPFLQSAQDDAVIIGQNVSKTPPGYNLFVSKGILAEKVKVAVRNTSEWSDNVFEDTYQLKGLVEIENYIKVHKHLPGIPSAEEMVEKGNDLHQTDAKLLGKIEELTLYSIKLEKANQEQQSINDQHQKKLQQQQGEIDELRKMIKSLMKKK